MAIKRITMQELADACGLSRNTVSKVFNERGTVPEATKQLVLRKAEELGYMQFNVEKNVSAEESSGDSAFQNLAYQSLHYLLILEKMLHC